MPEVRRECPMCGEFMRLKARDHTDHVPGTHQAVRREIVEWVCPECDHFEDVDLEDAATS